MEFGGRASVAEVVTLLAQKPEWRISLVREDFVCEPGLMGQVLKEPFASQRAGLLEPLGVGIEMPSGENVDLLGLTCLLVCGYREVGRSKDIVDGGQQKQGSGEM